MLIRHNLLYTWTQQTHLWFHLFYLVNVHWFNDVRRKNKFSCSACVKTKTKKKSESSLLFGVLPIKNIHLYSILCLGSYTRSSLTMIVLQARWMRKRDRRPARPRSLPLVYSAQTGSRVHPASFSVYSGVVSSAVRRPSSTEIKKACSCASNSHLSSWCGP